MTSVSDSTNREIQFHDVVIVHGSGMIMLIDVETDEDGKRDLVAVNKYIGLHRWLRTYSDGDLMIVGNVDLCV